MMKNDELNTYLSTIGNFQVLSRDEEKAAFEKLKNGSQAEKTDSKNKIANSNLKFVVSEAKKFLHKGLDYMDLISAGNIGLMEAIDHFDSEKNVRFITYAVWWIDEEMRRAICETGRCVRIPSNKKEELLNSRWTSISLDSPIAEDEKITLGNQIEDSRNLTPEEENLKDSESENLYLAISKLKAREKKVISMRYGLNNTEPKSLREISELYGFSKERVRQIEIEALAHLKSDKKLVA